MKKFLNILYMSGLIIAPAILQPAKSFAQQLQKPDEATANTVRMAANTEYDKAGKVKRILFGEHYRKDWAMAVDIAILDLEKEAGGLTPVKVGGGMQTKSLRLKGANGKEYVLRSVNKDPSKAIVAELRGTFAEDIVQDQISSANPYAPLAVAELAAAAGILHSTPKIVYIPHSARLGEFEQMFAGTVCVFEERPTGNEENNAAYGYSKKIINSAKLFEEVFSSSYHQVDEKSFLKARLFDLLIGDWDRHEDQWQWASFKTDEITFYQPIPRDRDQAFSKMDGIIPTMATRKWAMRKIQNFDYNINDLKGLSMSGNHLDRNFTTRLTKSEWSEVATSLKNALTDQVIDNAFRQMPKEIYAIYGNEIVAKLKQRRDHLAQYANIYYHFLAQEVNITGTKNKEVFEVTRINDDSTTVVMHELGKSDDILYKRTFLSNETKEIRLYGLGNDDVFNIKGAAKKGILVRIIGGKGQDTVTDHSVIDAMGHQTKVYDDKNNVFNTDMETKLVVSSDSLKNGYNRKSYILDWMSPTFNPGYNPDDGIYVGAGLVFKKQQFGKAPYGYMQLIGANYAFSTGAYSMWYKGIFTKAVANSDLHVGALFNSPMYTRNYYGMGNETVKDDNAEKDYYRVRISQIALSTSLNRQIGKNHTVVVGTEFQSMKVEDNDDRFISSEYSKTDSSDFGRKNYGRLKIGYQYSTIDNPLYPRKGIKLVAGTAYTRNLKESSEDFVQFTSEASFYNTRGRFTLAARTGFSTNIGDGYEFFQANTLGGLSNLRGYRRERFSGKTSLYSNTELRFRVSTVNAYLVKGTWGVLGFFDNGRVWTPEESSSSWHQGYGGGLWFLPFSKMAITATYSASKEDHLISIGTGFLF